MRETMIQSGMVDVPVSAHKIRSVYDFYSRIYFLATPLEKRAKMRGMELADVKPDDRVLEVAVGIGQSFLEILRRVDHKNTVYGVDVSPSMLEKTKARIERHGYENFDLHEADARHLPFADESFDVLYNSYMLDLIPLAELPVVIGEFRRVLRKDGRLVLVNLSKKRKKPVFYERVYKISPSFWGGCRPVLMEKYLKQAGFTNVRREYFRFPMPSEVVTGSKH